MNSSTTGVELQQQHVQYLVSSGTNLRVLVSRSKKDGNNAVVAKSTRCSYGTNLRVLLRVLKAKKDGNNAMAAKSTGLFCEQLEALCVYSARTGESIEVLLEQYARTAERIIAVETYHTAVYASVRTCIYVHGYQKSTYL